MSCRFAQEVDPAAFLATYGYASGSAQEAAVTAFYDSIWNSGGVKDTIDGNCIENNSPPLDRTLVRANQPNPWLPLGRPGGSRGTHRSDHSAATACSSACRAWLKRA